MKKLLSMFLSICMLVGCNNETTKNPTDVDSVICETKDHDKAISSFENTSNIVNSFADTDVEFDENAITYSAEYVDINSLTDLVENQKFIKTATIDEMLLQCTWTPTGESMYIGLIGKNDHLYFFELSTGSIQGILSLEDIPEDEYNVIMYSGCVHRINGTMNYQLQ